MDKKYMQEVRNGVIPLASAIAAGSAAFALKAEPVLVFGAVVVLAVIFGFLGAIAREA